MSFMSIISSGGKTRGFCLPGASGGSSTVSLDMDVIISEAPEYSAVPTKTQVESGADITDHVALEPESMTFEAIVTNTPVGWDKVLSGADFSRRADEAHAFILGLFRNREPFDFVGSLGVYKNVVLTKYNPTRDAKTGKALHFTARIDQITIVNSAMVASSDSSKFSSDTKHTGPAAENAGHQAAVEATDNSKSLAASLNDKYRFLPGLAR